MSFSRKIIHFIGIFQKAELKQCDESVVMIKSASQLVYEYYYDVSVAELKGYALVQLANMFRTVYNRDFRADGQSFRYEYLDRTRRVQAEVKHLLSEANGEVWKCDPLHWSLGVYEQVTKFLQGIVDNEVNLNPINDCKKTCSDYKTTKNYLCFNTTYCSTEELPKDRTICNGDIVDCEFIGADLDICPSSPVR